MILSSKETTIAYRCPECGKFIFGIVGTFTLSGDLIKLKCDCGESELVLAYTSEGKLKITVPCMFCPAPHSYLLSKDAFFERDILALTCTYSSLDVCFIGEKDKVIEAAKQADAVLLELLEDAGFASFDEFALGRRSVSEREDNVDQDFRIDYAQIEDVVRFILAELSEDGAIGCGCEDGEKGEYDFEFVKDKVRIFCKKCGYEQSIPMTSTLAANAFLHIDRLDLEKVEKTDKMS